MNPVVALYLAIKRKESGKFQFVPSGGDDFGVIKVALVEGNVVGFDSTWGTSFDNVRRMFGWSKAIIKKAPIGSDDHIARAYVPRHEALARIVSFELEGAIPRIRDIGPDEARDLMRIQIGKRTPLSPEEVRDVKEGKLALRSFFLQHNMDHAAVFVAGREIYTFRLTDAGVLRIPVEAFPEEDTFIVKVDHLVALTVAAPFFSNGREIGKAEVLGEVERLKGDPTKIWHMVLSGLGDIYVSVLGYRGMLIGVFVLYRDEMKLKGEKALKTIVETIDLKGRLYEYGTDMRSA